MISDLNRSLLLEFAAAGFEFFPLVKPWGDKKLGEPKGWPTLATSDLATINSWLETSKFGFGMAFGSKRCFAIDLDGEEGIENFKDAMKIYSIPDPSLVFKTPSGGRHLIYAYPSGINIKNVSGWQISTNDFNKNTKVDIRAEGGYIGSFGARENGYILTFGSPKDPLVPLPQVIIDNLPRKKDKSQLAASALALTKDMISSIESIDSTSSLYGVIPYKIFDGERDNTLFNLIASWVRNGVHRSNLVILLNEALRRCEGNTKGIDVDDMVDRTMDNPDFIFAKRSKALQILLKDLVFLSDINRYMTLHDKAIMLKEACEVKFSTLIEVGTKANGESIFLPLFKVWKSDDAKLVYRDYGYKPGNEAVYYDEVSGHNLVNTYSKPHIIPKTNDDIFNKFCEFANVICDGEEKGRFLVEFIAHIIKYPAVKIGVAPVIISIKHGVGKNFFLKVVTKLLGGRNVTQMYSDNIVNNFNSAIASSQLIIVNESIGERSNTFSAKAKNSQSMARIKSMITDYNQPIERKGHDIVSIRTYTNFMFFSNDLSAVSFDGSDRRFVCIINDQPPKDKEFYDSMDILKTKEGLAAILAGLMSMDLNKVSANMTHTEKTIDDVEVMRNSMTGHEEEIFNDIATYSIVFRSGFISATIFQWYCIYKFGLDAQKDRSFINQLRKQFFVPLYLNRRYRQSKQLTLDVNPFYIPVRNGTDSVPCGGKEVHQVWYLKPKHSEKPIYADDFELNYLREELLRCATHFQAVLKSGKDQPDLQVVRKGDREDVEAQVS